MEAKLQMQLRLAELDAKEENLMLDDEQSEISGRKSESHHSNISLKKYAKQLPSASKTQPCVSQTTSISANFTNVKMLEAWCTHNMLPNQLPLWKYLNSHLYL